MIRTALFLLALTVASGPLRAADATPPPDNPPADRRNVADALYGAVAEIEQADGTKKDASGVVSGSVEDAAAVRLEGMPATLTITFPAPTQINLVRIYPGVVAYADNPSGDSGLADYTVERFNNGYWHRLAEAKDQPGFRRSGADGAKTYFYEHAFRPVNASAVRIVATRSGFTGRTATSATVVPEDKRHAFVRAVEIYEARKSAGGLSRLERVVAGDFRLPVYRDQETAELQLGLLPFAKPLSLDLEVTSEADGRVVERRVVEVKGDTAVAIDLAAYADGRYPVRLAPTAEHADVKGTLTRMLRLDRGGTAARPAEPVDVSGSRIFPVDDFHFVRREGVSVRVVPATAVETSRTLAPDRPIQRSRAGNWFGQDEAGRFVQSFTDARLDNRDPKEHYAHSVDLKTWTVADQPPSGKANPRVPSPFDPLPPAAVPRWREKTPFKEARVRFHEDADGKPPLNEIRVAWLPPTVGDVAAKGLVAWGTYPVWERNPGEWIVLLREPLLVCKFGFEPDELEKDTDSNDNFAPQLLSDDGGTLFYAQAAKLRRFPPFTVEYDNLRQSDRIMRVHYTRDGFTWQSRFAALPTARDPRNFQHYGFGAMRVSRDFYIGYLHAYPAVTQQIHTEVMYSRDLLHWERLPDAPPFIANTPPGTWLFGMVFSESGPPPFEHEGEYFLPLGTSYRWPHFYLDQTRRVHEAGFDGEWLRRAYADRGLAADWPHFQAIGGWDGLAKDMRAAGNTVGFARFRKDGWIATTAGPAGGRWVSRVLSAPDGTLRLNGKGDFTVEVLAADETPLPDYSGARAARFTGDATDAALAWSGGAATRLPAAPFRLVVTATPGSDLYCLSF